MNPIPPLIPPNSTEVEQSVLGALLVDPTEYAEVMPILNKSCFYQAAHAEIFEAICALHAKDSAVDLVTVSDYLNRKEKLDDVGGYVYLAKLMQKVGSGAHLKKHAMILYELYSRRELARIGHEMVKKSYDGNIDITDITDHTQNQLLRLFSFEDANVRRVNDVIENVFTVMERNQQNDGTLSGIGTGLSEFDSFSGGLQKSDLVVIAGETSQGKTSLALTIANNAALRYGAKVAFYSLEMSNTQLVARLMAQETGVSSKAILSQKLDRKVIAQIDKHISRLENAEIYFDDSSTTKLDSILRSIRAMKVKYGIELVVVDYLQLVKASGVQNREQHVAEVARSLKNIARELNICIIALSQLSRSDSKKPTLNRLRDSGQIEEAADVIMLIYRPEAYDLAYEGAFKGYNPRSSALIDIAKGRNIGVKQFVVSFKKEATMFCDYASDRAYVAPERPF